MILDWRKANLLVRIIMEPLVAAEAIMVNADLWFGLCLLQEGDDAEKDTVLFSYLYLLSVCLTVDVMKNASIRVKANPLGILNFSCLRLYFIPYIYTFCQI